MSISKVLRPISFALAALLLMSSVAFASETKDDETSAPEKQDIIAPELMTSEDLSYETTVVERKTLNSTLSSTVTKFYPSVCDLTFENSGAKFVEFTVGTGDKVKSGDIIAKFKLSSSDAEYTRMKLSLQRSEEQYAENVRNQEKSIENKRASLSAITDEYERTIAELTLKKMEIELKQFKLRQQNYIDMQRKALEEETERRTTDVLLAPMDGVVRDLAYKKLDDPIEPGEVLASITSEDILLLAVPNAGGAYKYNMPVRVRLQNTSDGEWATGRVVATDSVIPKSERVFMEEGRLAFIQLDDPTVKLSNSRNFQMAAETFRFENVVLVPHSALTLESDESSSKDKMYVNKLVDGVPKVSYIDWAIAVNEGTWAVGGVEEGETLIKN